MEQKSKFSSLVEELVLIWWNWMRADTLCRDSTIPYSQRVLAAKDCELLIKNEYEVIAQMDKFFE